MKALITPLYKNGKRIVDDKKLKVFEGDLNVSDVHHRVLGRLVSEAVLLTERGSNVIDPMIDVRLTIVAAEGFRLRGLEFLTGQEVAQEWYVRPVGK